MDSLRYFEILFSGVREFTESPLPFFGKMAKGGDFGIRRPMTPEQASYTCEQLRSTHDLYSSIGICQGGGRDLEMNTEMIVGIAIDLDCEGPHRAKTNLFENIDEAMEFASTAPIAPSLIVNSGHGIQPYWIFKEPYVFVDDEDRKYAKGLIQGWIELFRRKTKRTIDPTYALNGLFRIPGTLNHKEEVPTDTLILAYNDSRSEPSEFDEFRISPSERIFVDKVVLKPQANLSTKVTLMLASAPEFSDIWHHRIRINDPSQSGWDWHIGQALIDAGLEDQEIADALVANRMQHGGKNKPPRYYQYTLAKLRARSPREPETKPSEDTESESEPEGAISSDLAEWYRALSRAVGIRVSLIEVDDPGHSIEDCSYVVYFESGTRVTVRKDSQVRSHKFWITHLRGVSPMDQTAVPTLARGEWERVIEKLRSHTVAIEADTFTTEMIYAIQAYLDATSTDVQDLETIRVTDKRSIRHGGRWLFLKAEFSHWYFRTHGKLDRTIFLQALRTLGATRRQVGRRGNSYTAIDADQLSRFTEAHVHRSAARDGGDAARDQQHNGNQAEPAEGSAGEDRLLDLHPPN